MINFKFQISNFKFLFLLPFAFLLLPHSALAQVVGTIQPPETVVREVGDTNAFISVIVRFITVVAGLYAMWQFLTGGLGYITSEGDKGKIQQSTQKIVMAVLGLFIIGASFILGSIIGRLLFGPNFDLFAPTLLTV